jgi:hypothetical protein
MDASIERVLLRRTGKLVAADGAASTPLPLLTTLQQILEGLGYSLSYALFERLRTLEASHAKFLFTWLVGELRKQVGAHRSFKPLYPNFPAQVMALDEAELYFNAQLHYWGLIDQVDAALPRAPRRDRRTLRTIDLLEPSDAELAIRRLFAARTPFSPQDRSDVTLLAAAHGAAAPTLLPAELPCRENLAVIAAALLRSDPAQDVLLDAHVRTATDVLRIAVALADGDVSLAEPTRFGRLSRALRVRLLGWIERSRDPLETMQRHRGRWIRLGERLHPGEYTTRFPRAAGAFQALRNGERASGFNARAEAALAGTTTSETLALLCTRPGELARRLDRMLRDGHDPNAVIGTFAHCGDAVSTAVLLQVLTHFEHRTHQSDLRVFFPKGQVAKLFALPDTRRPIAPAAADAVVATCRDLLLRRFAQRPALGACHVDARLARYLVPFSQRSASKTLRTIGRGSRVPLPACSTLRFFVWWRNGRTRVDIDLSAAMYGEGFDYLETLSYYCLKTYGAYHSGDIVDAPQGACEFIDIDRQRCLDAGVRYVVMSLSSFTSQPYCDLPECYAGWMARSDPQSGEVFEPAAVVDRFDIASNTKFCLPLVFDLQTSEAIWCDIALATRPWYANNVANHLRGVSLMLRAMTGLRKTDLKTLFDLHVAARGRHVDAARDADYIFSVDAGVTPLDLDTISAEFL